MGKVKGVIENIRESTFKTKDNPPKDVPKVHVKLEGGNIEYEAFGHTPEEWKKGVEVELEYEIRSWTDKDKNEHSSYTITNKPKSAQKGGGYVDMANVVKAAAEQELKKASGKR